MNDESRSGNEIPEINLPTHLKSESTRSNVRALPPVHVLTIENPGLNQGRQRDKSVLMRGLSETIALAGYLPQDAAIDDACYFWLYDFGRNHSWKDLPIIRSPRIAHDGYQIRALDSTGAIDRSRHGFVGASVRDDVAKLLRDRVKVVIVACFEPLDTYVFRALAAFHSVANDELPMVLFHTPNGGWIVTPDDVIRIRDRYRAESRFNFNYAINFSIFARRALMAAAQDINLPKHSIPSMLPILSELNPGWAYPVFLQILFWLKRTGAIGTEQDYHELKLQEDIWSSWLFVTGIPLFERRCDGFDFVWKGTGTYPEWRLDIGKVKDPDFDLQKKFDAFFEHQLLGCFTYVSDMRLLGLKDGRIVLTPLGLRFLEIVGPEMDDPDMLLRWRTSSGDMGHPGDIVAMDRWLNRSFRAFKRRVAGLSDRLKSMDDDGAVTGPFPVHLGMSIYGICIPLNQDDFNNPAISAALGEIKKSNEDRDLSASRSGIIFEPSPMSGEAKAIGVWFGVPIKVQWMKEYLLQEPGWLRDMSKIKCEAEAAISAAPTVFRDPDAAHDPRIHHEIVVEGEDCFDINLPWSIDSSPGDSIHVIIKGIASTIDTNAAIPEGVASFLWASIPAHTPPVRTELEPRYYDILHHNRGPGGMHSVVCGYFVGLYNETTGEFVTNESFSKTRAERFKWLGPKLMASAHFCFEIDRKENGYWAMLSDGTVKRIDA